MRFLAVALALVLIGCGGGSPTAPTAPAVVVPTTTSTTTTTTTLPPAAVAITETFSGTLSAGDAPCVSAGIHDGKPCRRYPFVASTAGPFEATLTWSDRRNDLDLELWRGGTRLISTLGVTETEQMSSNLTAGSYEVRVVYYNGSTTQTYALRITRQN
jgi:hypothetical protein